jgi:hypothetical protein
VLYRKGSKAFFVFGFSKNLQGNICDDEHEHFKRAAKVTLALTQEQRRSFIEKAQMEEVFRGA